MIRDLKIEIATIPPASTPLTPSARLELDSAIHLAKIFAQWRDTISWSELERRVRRTAAGAKTTKEVHPAIRLLAHSLGDDHSSFYSPTDVKAFRSSENVPVIDVRVLSRGVGYIYVSGYLAEDPEVGREYVRKTYDAISRSLSSVRCGWVLDLRGNGGGVPEPMLASLAPFIPPESLQTDEQAGLEAWFPGMVVPRPLKLNDAFAAVLTGPQTGSAGERVLLALRRRHHSRTFGGPTAGLATRRAMFWLPDSAMLAITTGPMESRRPMAGPGPIVPDELISTDASGHDAVLAAATTWLSTHACDARKLP
jgi:C-terminal processing protease CtpA/Prc